MKWKNIVGIGIVIWLVNQGTGFFKRVFGHHPESRRIEYVERGSGHKTLYDIDDQAKGIGARALEWIDLYNAGDEAIQSNHNRHVAEEAWRDETRIKVKKQEADLAKRLQSLNHKERNQQLKEQREQDKRIQQARRDAQKRADRLEKQRREAQKAADRRAEQIIRYNKSH